MNIGIPAVPNFPSKPFHSRLAHNDAVSKMKMKNYADQRRHTRDSDIRTGDHALVKQQKRNKLTPLYDPHPYSVVKKRGSLMVARRGNHFVTRNSSFFKPMQTDVPSEEEEEEEVDAANQFDSQPETMTPETVTQSQTPSVSPSKSKEMHTPRSLPVPESPTDVSPQQNRCTEPSQAQPAQATPRRSSQRSVVLPKKFKDFIMT